MNKNKKIFLAGLVSVFVWNFSVPRAQPLYDVLFSVELSFLVNALNKSL